MRILAALLLFSDVSTAPSGPVIDGVAPIQMFDAACRNGSAQLGPEAKQISFNKLPLGAKAVIGDTIYRTPQSLFRADPPGSKDVPNPVFQLEHSGKVFLITTTPQPAPGARFADSCMVIWKSDDFTAAHSYILGGRKSPIPWSTVKGIFFDRTNDGTNVITGATRGEWTILRSGITADDPLADVSKSFGAKKK